MAKSDSLQGSRDNLSSDGTIPVPAMSTTKEVVADHVPRDFFVIPIPRYLRHNPEKPVGFSLFLNILFAGATTFSA